MPIARLHVTPRVTAGEDAAVFEGDIYLDAARHQIVRLHGRFVRLRAPGSAQQRVERVTGTTVATFVDITNGEIDGQFWLPISERVEIHVGSPVLSEARAVWRLSASFGNYQVALTSSDSAAVQGASTTTDITYASADSLDAYASWPVPAAVRVRRTIDDFADVMPPEWRAWGPPRLMFSPSRFAHVLHVNPVEGYYTGLEGKLEMRSVAPGWSARGHAG